MPQGAAFVLRNAEQVADQLYRDGGRQVIDDVDDAALAAASSSRSTSTSMRGSIAFSARGVKTGASSRRTRVGSAGR